MALWSARVRVASNGKYFAVGPTRFPRFVVGESAAVQAVTPPKIEVMVQTLHASHNGSFYLTQLRGVIDVADLVREHRLETLTTANGRIVFWFSAHQTIRLVNRQAVKLLLSTTNLTARQVPLLLGNVVLSGRDAGGELADLTDEQARWLVNVELGVRDEWILGRRFADYVRQQRRHSRAEEAARWAALLQPPS